MKYIITLSVISCAYAFSLSKKPSKCVERCNQLPFKVSIEPRRKACLAGCGSPDVGPPINAEVESSLSNDATCIEHCNAQKGSRRSKRACIKQCPVSSEYYESINQTDSSEVETTTSAEFDLQSYGIESVNASSPIKVDLEDEKSKSENITSTESKSPTRLSLQGNAHSINSTSSAETSHNETELQETLETNSESINRSHPSEDEANTSGEFDLQSDGIESGDVSSPIEVDLQDEKSNSQNIIETDSEFQTASIDGSDAAALNSTQEGSIDLRANITSFAMPADHLMNDTKKDELQTGDQRNFTIDLTEVKIEAASEAENGTIATPTSDKDITLPRNNSRTNSFDVPSVVPAAAPDTTSNTRRQNDTPLSLHLDSEVDASSVDYSQECIDRCNGKRTLKRKREACLKRCRSFNDLTFALKRGYASSMIEL